MGNKLCAIPLSIRKDILSALIISTGQSVGSIGGAAVNRLAQLFAAEVTALALVALVWEV